MDLCAPPVTMLAFKHPQEEQDRGYFYFFFFMFPSNFTMVL